MTRPFHHRSEPLWILAALAVGVLLIGLPTGVVVSALFDAGGEGLEHLMRTRLADYVRTSLGLAAAVVPAVAVLGGLTAWAVSAYDFPGARVLRWALVLPLALPPYLVAYAYTDFVQAGGLLFRLTGLSFDQIRSVPGAAAVLASVFYPYVFLAARAAFTGQAAAQIDAARLLGAGGARLMYRIALPLAWPAIAAGCALAAMETLADYGTVAFFGISSFTTGIYRAWFSLGEPQLAARLSAWLLVFVALALLGERLARGRRRFADGGGSLTVRRLTGWRGWTLSLLCCVPLVAGFGLPMALLVINAATAPMSGRGDWAAVLANTLMLGAVAALIAAGLAMLLAASRRFARRAGSRAAVSLANFGYAIPGSVVAIGLLIPLIGLDRLLISAFGVQQLLFTGSTAALVIAYQVRFLPLALRPLEAGYAKIPRAVDEAGTSLGAGAGRVLRRLHLPLLQKSLGVGALLVFVETVKELPATLILRPFNVDTLAVRAHQLAADERLAQAALPSLIIALVGLLPILALSARPNVMRPAPPAAWPRLSPALSTEGNS